MPYVNPTLASKILSNVSVNPYSNPTLYHEQEYLRSQINSVNNVVNNPTKENLNALN